MGSISSGSSSSDGSERKPWQQLMRAFLDRVALPVTAEEADGIWRMFAGDAWFADRDRGRGTTPGKSRRVRRAAAKPSVLAHGPARSLIGEFAKNCDP